MDDIANQGVGVACTKGLKPEVANQDSFVRAAFDEHFSRGFIRRLLTNVNVIRSSNLLNEMLISKYLSAV